MAPVPDWLQQWFISHGYPVPDDIPAGAETQYYGGDGATGGTAAPNGAPPVDTTLAAGQPAYGTYDPALEAERRAQERGLSDTLLDTKRQRHRATHDYEQQMRDLEQTQQRGQKDIGRQRKRGLRDIKQKRGDVTLTAERGREDFGSRVQTLIHNFQIQGANQLQTANARGVTEGSTLQASAAARAGNFARAKAPLDTGLARLNQDETRSLTRLGTAQQDLLGDTHRARHQLRQDVSHDTQLANRDFHRTIQDIHTQRQRAKREQAIGSADIIGQEAYQAYSLHPGTIPNPQTTGPPAPTGAGGGGGQGGGQGGIGRYNRRHRHGQRI